MRTMRAMNIVEPDIIPKATDHIADMIALIQTLQKKGYVYETAQALYFDVSKFADYGKLSGQKLEDKLKGAREDVYVDNDKKNDADFSLWFKTVGRFQDHSMHWLSPWGEGFPGWHIECSAMSMKYLGETLDIHTGGVDHIPVHHENEIAQSESATGKKFVRYWVHNEFLQIEGQKMSKSLRNFLTIENFMEKEIDPMSLRLLFLQTHYHQQMNFTWDAVYSAQEAYKKLRNTVLTLKKQTKNAESTQENKDEVKKYQDRFRNAISSNLQLPKAVAILFEMIKSDLSPAQKLVLITDFDTVLGLKLDQVEEEAIPEELIKLAEERLVARAEKNWAVADKLRDEITKQGYTMEDSGESYKLKKNT